MQHKTGKDQRQMFFTPLEDMVSSDSFARVIDWVAGALPLGGLGFKHVELNSEGYEPYHAGDILKLMIYGQRMGSAQRINCLMDAE